MYLDDGLKKRVIVKIQEDSGVIISQLAKELAVPEQVVMECLPENEVRKAEPHHFDAVMETIATWGSVTTIVQTESMIFEAKSMIPRGSYGHGYFNLMGGRGHHVGGHIRADLLAAIYFVDRPFMGLKSLSVQFFSLSGAAMFKVYVGRDEKRQLFSEQVEHFKTLRQQMTTQHCSACSA